MASERTGRAGQVASDSLPFAAWLRCDRIAGYLPATVPRLESLVCWRATRSPCGAQWRGWPMEARYLSVLRSDSKLSSGVHGHSRAGGFNGGI